MRAQLRPSFFVALAMVSLPLLLGAKGGCGGDVDLGDDKGECVKEACGGMPDIACADGTSPYTGRCLARADGKCAWEKRDCGTKTACTPCAVPDIACSDGTSPYGGCYLDSAGKCVAEYKGCAGECPVEKCGPALGMPSWTCEDGKTGGSTGRCLDKGAGTCGWEVIDCPRKCEASECGPAPTPVKCADGSTPASSCKRQTDGTCKWLSGSCPESACKKVESLPRACTSKAQCTFGLHQINCCGSQRAMGYTVSAYDSFTPLEKACRESLPACGCPTEPTVDDSGKPGSEFAVDCVGGVCTTYVTKGI